MYQSMAGSGEFEVAQTKVCVHIPEALARRIYVSGVEHQRGWVSRAAREGIIAALDRAEQARKRVKK